MYVYKYFSADFPWLVGIMSKNPKEELGLFSCGGTLIHPSVVLTAAHCVSEREPYKLEVRVGLWGKQTRYEIFPRQDRLVEKIVLHPEYKQGYLCNNIALLFLTEPATYPSNANTICLPSQNLIFDGNSQCFTTYWQHGLNKKPGIQHAILQENEYLVLPRTKCEEYYEKGIVHRSFLHDNGGGGHTYYEDLDGSSVICTIPNTVDRYYHAGIVTLNNRLTDVKGIMRQSKIVLQVLNLHLLLLQGSILMLVSFEIGLTKKLKCTTLTQYLR